ncbi:UPF0061-domain-containing protein [Ceraceosorus guamensis]|uniref:Selenoprotein O n=1 Tax=Ceraceosorus guamensis TaxID=1522189 RepID=A0A316VT25_9BASI|nr:UPF0061-domain-containing protein [Ceraceosorus guamensis]PWN40642.1 UPF0061-domain-containing protein [Ceraceosorus guamensis]
MLMQVVHPSRFAQLPGITLRPIRAATFGRQISTSAMVSTEQPSERVPILRLPLPPVSDRLQSQLLSDPAIPSASSLLGGPNSAPSATRRSRAIGSGALFSFVDPLPLSFPYDFTEKEIEHANEILEREEQVGESGPLTEQEKAGKRIEVLLREYAPLKARDDAKQDEGLQAYLPRGREKEDYPSARLLGVASRAHQEHLPGLDIGDAQEWIESHQGVRDAEAYTSGSKAASVSKQDGPAHSRQLLSDVLSGRVIGARFATDQIVKPVQPSEEETSKERWQRREKERVERAENSEYAPWANAYAGHQFGVWAGQLGDGRAITLFETPEPRTEVQLKGAGRTPYSRFADGLATLASSTREYLGSEAVAALGIPSSRALALVSLPELKVIREKAQTAGICTRLARSWLRVGSFQHQASRGEWESVRALGEWVARIGYGWDLTDGKPWARILVEEAARRNARTIALWQVYGFLHGVMNTDNISMLGLTIDYGPYGFIDIVDKAASSNKSDGEGRYVYKNQPSAGAFAIEHLTFVLSPLIALEEKSGRAVRPGELLDLPEKELTMLSDEGEEKARESVKELFKTTLEEHYRDGWRDRLGLVKDATTKSAADENVEKYLIDPLLDVLEDTDLTNSLRKLCDFPALLASKDAKEAAEAFSTQWLDEATIPAYARAVKKDQAQKWLEVLGQAIKDQNRSPNEVTKHMKSKNPKFVLRNWVTDEVVDRLERQYDTDFLQRVLNMCYEPFNEWGSEDVGEPQHREEAARLCTIGRPLYTGMPSCSS